MQWNVVSFPPHLYLSPFSPPSIISKIVCSLSASWHFIHQVNHKEINVTENISNINILDLSTENL